MTLSFTPRDIMQPYVIELMGKVSRYLIDNHKVDYLENYSHNNRIKFYITKEIKDILSEDKIIEHAKDEQQAVILFINYLNIEDYVMNSNWKYCMDSLISDYIKRHESEGIEDCSGLVLYQKFMSGGLINIILHKTGENSNGEGDYVAIITDILSTVLPASELTIIDTQLFYYDVDIDNPDILKSLSETNDQPVFTKNLAEAIVEVSSDETLIRRVSNPENLYINKIILSERRPTEQ